MTGSERRSALGAPSPERWKEVRAIAESALAMPLEARDAFLSAGCRGDEQLRAEVEMLVRACESAEQSPGFLGAPAAALAESMLESALREALADRYALDREIGRGGMARVYLAHDRRHHRRVAIKLLNPELGAVVGAERFLAEIAVTASLQHPNLLPLFDSGEAAGLLYYVMPFIEGESLRARLRRDGQLPVEEAVRLVAKVAGALDHAHRRGIVHRDLKPENILLHEGEPLVADFGIALALSGAEGTRLTEAGMPLGTPSYMSPEQATADRPVDSRSDVYSLGCVLYEMLAGEPPHVGGTVRTVMTRVITQPPLPIRALRPSVPAAVETALERALSKLPADRFASAGDFALALSSSTTTADRAAPAVVRNAGLERTSPVARGPWRRPLVLSIAASILLAAIALGWSSWLARDRASVRTTRFVIGGLSTTPIGGTPTITPDGRHLVYAGGPALGRPLVVRALDTLQGRSLPGIDGVTSTFVSPDGRWIGFLTADDKLKKVPLGGGRATTLASVFRFSRARWASSGVIVMDGYGARGLTWVADSGGTLRSLTTLDGSVGELSHAAPFVLPSGRVVVFTVQRQRGGPAPVIGELAMATLPQTAAAPGPHVRLGIRGRRAIAYVDGWLLYTGLDGASILAVRLDADGQRSQGPSVPVLLESEGMIDGAELTRDGTLLYMRRNAANAPVLVGAGGVRESMPGHASGSFMNPRYSRDGRRIVLQGQSPQGSDVWIYDVSSHASTRLTATGNASLPSWTPDGRGVVFVSTRSGRQTLWSQAADGSTPPVKLVDADDIFAGALTPDGSSVVFQQQADSAWEIWSARVDGDRALRPLVRESFDNYMPAVSPDGRWLAYTSNASGREEVYVRSFPVIGAPVQVSVDGGKEPVWSHDGRRLHFRSGRTIVSAQVSATNAFAVSSRAPMLEDVFEGGMPHANYDVTPDGRRLLMIAPESVAGSEMVVALNWLTELRAKLRAKT
jgi:serine/threonine-protein kinase